MLILATFTLICVVSVLFLLRVLLALHSETRSARSAQKRSTAQIKRLSARQGSVPVFTVVESASSQQAAYAPPPLGVDLMEQVPPTVAHLRFSLQPRREGNGFRDPAVEVTLATDVSRRNILVVDDESQITRVLRMSLSGQGYSVQTAGDGEQALDIMRHWTPDLVITDLSMPKMGGLELCRRIRSNSNIPIIVLSLTSEEQPKILALDSGADDYVTKPFNMNELVARVRVGLRIAS